METKNINIRRHIDDIKECILELKIDHAFISNGIGMNVNTFRGKLYADRFNAEEKEKIGKLFAAMAEKLLAASKTDTQRFEEYAQEEGEFSL